MQIEKLAEYIALTVKSHRQRSGLSQNELAEMAGIGKTTVFDIEHAKSTVKLINILKVFNVLNIEICLNSPLMGQMEHEHEEG